MLERSNNEAILGGADALDKSPVQFVGVCLGHFGGDVVLRSEAVDSVMLGRMEISFLEHPPFSSMGNGGCHKSVAVFIARSAIQK